MRRPGRDPRRRNRNQGTAKRGRGRSNRHVIPDRWPDGRAHMEGLVNPVSLTRRVAGRDLPFLVEPPRPPAGYPVTVDDVVHLFSLLPEAFTAFLDLIVFRQPTKRERLLDSVWGRLLWFADLGSHRGLAVYVESQVPGEVRRWSRHLTPRDQEELGRLRRDGHRIRETRRHFEIVASADSMRNTVLYHTVLHELGHLADGVLSDDYTRKTLVDREAFAARFAEGLRALHESKGDIPFPRRLDPDQLAATGLRAEWFLAPDDPAGD